MDSGDQFSLGYDLGLACALRRIRQGRARRLDDSLAGSWFVAGFRSGYRYGLREFRGVAWPIGWIVVKSILKDSGYKMRCMVASSARCWYYLTALNTFFFGRSLIDSDLIGIALGLLSVIYGALIIKDRMETLATFKQDREMSAQLLIQR